MDAKVNRADNKIEDLKINLEALTDKLTTADEFISSQFYPHLNSLEINIKDTQGTKTDESYTFQGSARVFYMYKNNSSKGILELYIRIKEDNSELIISNAPTAEMPGGENNIPRLLESNGKTEFKPFSINIPLKSVVLVVPVRSAISATEITDNSKSDKKEEKKNKKEKIKPVDE